MKKYHLGNVCFIMINTPKEKCINRAVNTKYDLTRTVRQRLTNTPHMPQCPIIPHMDANAWLSCAHFTTFQAQGHSGSRSHDYTPRTRYCHKNNSFPVLNKSAH